MVELINHDMAIRITNKKELKIYLLNRIKQSEVYKKADPSRYDAINEICGAILKNYLRSVSVDPKEYTQFQLVVSSCTSLYIDFFSQRNTPPYLDQEERYWMKEIVQVLHKSEGSLSDVIPKWKDVLSNWDNYHNRIRNWPKLRNIRQNLILILTYLNEQGKNRRISESVAADLATRSSSGRRDSEENIHDPGQDDN